MVRLNKIYTRTGDAGTTGLASGKRVPKHHPRIQACGAVDETNAAIGVARAWLTQDTLADPALDEMLARIQNDLFDLGADLSLPEDDAPPDQEALRITQAQVARLEADIDRLNGELAPLRSFVLPGGNHAAAALHMARTICRRAESRVSALMAEDGEAVSSSALCYINRLSDFLFVAARHVNEKGKGDVLWVPGKNR